MCRQVVAERRATHGAVRGPGRGSVWRRWAPSETIAQSAFNLAASRYKPRVGEAVLQEDPAKLIRHAREIKQQVTAGLRQPLLDVDARP